MTVKSLSISSKIQALKISSNGRRLLVKIINKQEHKKDEACDVIRAEGEAASQGER